MGHKVSPISFRLGKLNNWQSKWFAKRDYSKFLLEDLSIREFIRKNLRSGYVSRVDIARDKNIVIITVYTARPGVIIGRSGAGVTALKENLKKLIQGEIRINVEEIKEPDLDAYLVALNIAQQIEKRISYKRAMKQAKTRVMTSGAKGIKVNCKGRLAGVEIARSKTMSEGSLPLGTIRANIDFGQIDAKTTFGIIGVKVWINKGDK
ncbi:MAG: 30S ribosomal protein S3 [Candidatus Berkelbacteria bacterium]|nr:30S ribosomal protein S3 [Candidatus Berkelbacteria bacterium]